MCEFIYDFGIKKNQKKGNKQLYFLGIQIIFLIFDIILDFF